MRITDITIDGFGIFHNHAIKDLPSGLTLFEGSNEAGKSTLMAFIRAVLFGFEGRKSGNNRYEPLRGGRHGGALALLTDEGTAFRIERAEGGAYGRVVVSDSTGQYFQEDLVQRLLYRTSKVLYQNVFAFGLSELQRLDTLQAEEISHHLYTAGLGTGSVPFSEVMSALEDEQGQLFKTSGKKPIINGLWARLDANQRTIRELQTLPDEYDGLRYQAGLGAEEILRLQGEVEKAKRKVDWLETLIRARPDWEKLVTIQRELGGMSRIDAFPEGGVERLDQLERTLTGLDTRHDETQRGIRELEKRRTKLTPDSLLLQHRDSIQALVEDREHFRKLQEALPRVRAKAESRRKALDDVLARLGPDWDDRRLAGFDTSIPTRERIRAYRDRLATVKQESASAAKRPEEMDRIKRAKEAEVDRLQRSLDGLILPDSASKPTLDEREKALRHWVQFQHQLDLIGQHQRDVQQLREPLAEQLNAHEAETALLERQVGLPMWVIIAVGLLFGTLAGTALYLRQEILAAALVVAGIMVDGMLLWYRDHLQNERQARVDELQRQRQTLISRSQELQEEAELTEREIQGFSQKMTSLGQIATGQGSPSAEEVEETRLAMEPERRLLDRRKDLEIRIQEEEEALVRLLEEREASDQPLKTAERDCEAVNQDWVLFLKTLELAEGLTPEGALEVLGNVEGAKVQLREWHDSHQELERGEEEVGSLATQLNQVLERCGWEPVLLSESAATLLTLRKSLGESVDARLEFDRLGEQLAAKKGDLVAIDAERARLVEQRQGLLAAAGALDPEDFRRRAGRYKGQSELDRQQRQLEIALRVHAGTPEGCQELERVLSTTPQTELERVLEEATTGERDSLVTALAQQLQDKGGLEQQIQSMEHNERLSIALLEQQTLLAQLDQQAQRWAVRRITQHLLDKARQIYERERQPAVLKQASDYLRAMTGGRYTRIIVPLGETRLEVESKNGRMQGAERLSRGTAEQLYLAMRLAFVREYAKHAGPLPLVIDDILVNFDPERARAAIKVFMEVATTHQILFFTCHPHVKGWFQESRPNLEVRPLSVQPAER